MFFIIFITFNEILESTSKLFDIHFDKISTNEQARFTGS